MFDKLIDKTTEEIRSLYLRDSIPWIIGCSWGKDSTTVVQLVWNAIATLPPAKRTKSISIITTDTRVEEILVRRYVKKQIDCLNRGAIAFSMPFHNYLLRPEIENSFFVRVIGHGYAKPSQNGNYRWCTSRLKIDPADKFIKEHISHYGESYLVLGVRKEESSARARSIAKRAKDSVEKNLNPSDSLPNSTIYTPIVDWSTNDVWMYLLQCDNPWGGDNQEIFRLYRGATQDNECPLVTETGTQSCGKSRFGCWVCTVVTDNKSLEATIDNGNDWLQPLLDFRNELADPDDRDKRDFRYAYKHKIYELNVNSNTNIQPQPGRYTKQWREVWLEKLLEAQVQVQLSAPLGFEDVELISLEELSLIRHVWRDKFHYFDDRLPEIYLKVTGKIFPESDKAKFYRYIDTEDYQVITQVVKDEQIDAELISSLLAVEHEFLISGKRQHIYKELEKTLLQHAYSPAEKIVAAYREYLGKQAIERGEVYRPLQAMSDEIMLFE